jgi:hypothetical protein
MTKHRRTRRRGQKGGFLGFGESSEPSVQQPQQSSDQGWFSWIGTKTKESADKINTGIGSAMTSASDTAKSGLSSMAEGITSLNPFGSSDTSNVNTGVNNGNTGVNNGNTGVNNVNPISSTGVVSTGSMGGRRRKRCRSMKGGKGGSNLAYYAAPVSGLKVAEPTSWQYYANGVNQYSVKGGSRKRRGRKSRRTRRHKRR